MAYDGDMLCLLIVDIDNISEMTNKQRQYMYAMLVFKESL